MCRVLLVNSDGVNVFARAKLLIYLFLQAIENFLHRGVGFFLQRSHLYSVLLRNHVFPVIHFLVVAMRIFGDHTECMVLALQLYDVCRESILGFASKKALGGERIALVNPTLRST